MFVLIFWSTQMTGWPSILWGKSSKIWVIWVQGMYNMYIYIFISSIYIYQHFSCLVCFSKKNTTPPSLSGFFLSYPSLFMWFLLLLCQKKFFTPTLNLVLFCFPPPGVPSIVLCCCMKREGLAGSGRSRTSSCETCAWRIIPVSKFLILTTVSNEQVP